MTLVSAVVCVKSIRQLQIPIWPGNRRVSANAPHLVVLVGGDDTTRSFDPAGANSDLRKPDGTPWRYGWGQAAEDPVPLPPSLSVGNWLTITSRLGETGAIVCDMAFQAVGFDASQQECAELGRELAGRAAGVAMLVMDDGSASGRSARQVLAGAVAGQHFHRRQTTAFGPAPVIRWRAERRCLGVTDSWRLNAPPTGGRC